jgi:fatty-acyl-CoA synthase
VIGIKDPHRGETVKAMVVLRADAVGHTQPEDIVAWAHEHMAPYKAPRVVELVDTLPKSASGKVMWRSLQEQEAQRHASPKTPPQDHHPDSPPDNPTP